jgi:hypothetical protein
MIGIALLEFDRKVTHAFQEAIQKLRDVSHGKDLIRDLEPLVQRCAEQPCALRQMWEHGWLLLANLPDQSDDQRIGETLLSAINGTLETLRQYQQLCDRLEKLGFPVPSAPKLGPAVEEVERIKMSMDNWPWANRQRPEVDPRMLEESLAAIARGETGVELAEFIRELEGQDPS